MSVWFAVPSKRPPAEAVACLRKWKERGYNTIIMVDAQDVPAWAFGDHGVGAVDLMHVPALPGRYPGYAQAVNTLVRQVLHEDPKCDWIVTGGDDVFPDPNHTADEIAAQCSEHFGGKRLSKPGDWTTFGVMQPTGDRWGEEEPYARQMWPDAPAMIDRICGSPWMGRSFCERINQGNGPLWPEYFHNWVDEELQNVAIKYGCFWQRRDLTHYHNHCVRTTGQWAPHLAGATADYHKFEPLFRARKAAGFPGSEPL